MGIKNFFKNRYNILYMIMTVLLIVLSFKMAVMTIVEGQSYREKADTKKIKDIPVKAPRGKIYDRNGVILADNITSFTVQMYKDQMIVDKINDTTYILSKIFDENSERPIDEVPIVLNTYEYIDENLEVVQSEQNVEENTNATDAIDTTAQIIVGIEAVQDKVVRLVKENVREWLNYEISIYGEVFNLRKKVFDIIKRDKSDMPIEFVDGQFIYADDRVAVDNWLQGNELNLEYTAEDVISNLLLKDSKYMLNLFSNSKVRKLSYDFLDAKNLTYNIKLVEYSFIQDNEYKKIKKNLNDQYKEINEKTSAKDDFIFLIMKYAIDDLLQNIYETGSTKVIPGAILYEKLKQTYNDLPITYNEGEKSISYEYTDLIVKEKYLNMHNLSMDTEPYILLKELSMRNHTLLKDFITDDKIKYLAQSEMLKHINPYISISEWQYTSIRDKNRWITSNIPKTTDTKDIEEYTAKEVFGLLKKRWGIAENINDYDVRNMLVIRERYNKQSYLSYHPIDICYGISEKSVAMISERSHELVGLDVEIEPVRYYPEYSSGAHVLGYLGKISQDYEIEQYIEKRGYMPDDIIGKTGVEEKFEEYLKGDKGKKTVEVNSVGATMKSLSREEPIPGDDLYLTIDINLQKKCEEVLEKGLKLIREGGTYESEWGNFKFANPYKNAQSGSIVALDIKTGEVLALANYPSYDLNMFTTGISTEDWNSLLNDSKDVLAPRPLYNIALLTAIQPGSTFKMVTALAALEKGVNPYEQVYCAGVMEVGGRRFGCWIYNMFGGSHGYRNMYTALRDSCNFYFYTSVLGENPATKQSHSIKITADNIIDIAKKFGLDSETGIEIDVPKEYSGGVPSIDSNRISMRVYLRMFLEGNLETFLETGYVINEEEKQNIIEEIVSWIDAEELMTRGQVLSGLEDLKIDVNKVNNNNRTLADIIKYDYLNVAVWNPGDNLNISIGQGSNSYTPIQMANYVSIIANGGYKRNVSVVKDLRRYDGRRALYIQEDPIDGTGYACYMSIIANGGYRQIDSTVKNLGKYNNVNGYYEPKRSVERIELSDYSHLDVLRESMKMVSDSDNSRPYARFPVGVASKTGTAQKDGINPETGEQYDDFAWYVAYAPYDDPQIVVSCVLFQGGSGTYPTPLVREVIAEYLRLNAIIEPAQTEDMQTIENTPNQ